MITVTKTFEWDMGHRVTNHDSVCRNLHGHRYRLNVTVAGLVNTDTGNPKQGMVIDFGDLKKIVNQNVVDIYDHSFMYWSGDHIMDSFFEQNPELKHSAVDFIPTAECLAEHIESILRPIFHKIAPAVHVTAIELYETPKSRACWEPGGFNE